MEVSVMRCTWAALCIAVLVMSGSAEGASLEVTKSTKSDPLYTYDFTLNIINRIFNDSLLNPKSQDYKVMYEEISSALYSVYGCPACDTHSIYQGVKAMTFSNKTGSVVVQATLIFLQGQINSVVIKFLFLQAINGRNEINGFKINPEFTRVISGSALVPSVSSTSQPTSTTTTSTTIRLTTYPCETFTSTNHPINDLFMCDPFLSSTTTTTTTTTTTPTTTPATTATTPTTTPTTTTTTTTPTTTPTTLPSTTPTTITTSLPTPTPTTTPTTPQKVHRLTW
ncbi:G8 domain-containing protein DDB_G0286311-like isoform X1 [Tachysurus vachellii]|uniref:G8 domain-containing protein DDB_G0286311-like isoform X1 n=1 Tax=Tachysurus vachellii TaxID=175792 RepID=UPI00296ACCC5|nr:G8 domain-containing protein DDB_G0286311-like isoform X1 [Tachysurus vachellii]